VSLHIRPRTAGDCAVIVSWIADAGALYQFTGSRLRWPLTVAQLTEMEDQDVFTAWTLTDKASDATIGHFDLTIEKHVARIGRVIIDPARRGRGLAGVLMRFALEQAQLLGAESAQLNVIANNQAAIRTYLRAGFSEQPFPDRPDVHRMAMAIP
jgi:ribosomal protein S18 acetylase RimI-like enzyme